LADIFIVVRADLFFLIGGQWRSPARPKHGWSVCASNTNTTGQDGEFSGWPLVLVEGHSLIRSTSSCVSRSCVVMLGKGDPVEIAEHYRRIMDGTLVDHDDS
jgi:hypothetical protein